MSRTLEIDDPKTGKTLSIEWDADRDPTDAEVNEMLGVSSQPPTAVSAAASTVKDVLGDMAGNPNSVMKLNKPIPAIAEGKKSLEDMIVGDSIPAKIGRGAIKYGVPETGGDILGLSAGAGEAALTRLGIGQSAPAIEEFAKSGVKGAGKILKQGADKLERIWQAFKEGSKIPEAPVKPSATNLPTVPVKPVQSDFNLNLPNKPEKPTGANLDLPAERSMPAQNEIDLKNYYRGHVEDVKKNMQIKFGDVVNSELVRNPDAQIPVTNVVKKIATSVKNGTAEQAVLNIVRKNPPLSKAVMNEIRVQKMASENPLDDGGEYLLKGKDIQSVLSKTTYLLRNSIPLNQESREVFSDIASEVSEAFPKLAQARKEYARGKEFYRKLVDVQDNGILKSAEQGKFVNPSAQEAADYMLPENVKTAMNAYKKTSDDIKAFNDKIADMRANGTPMMQSEYREALEKYNNALDKAKYNYQRALAQYANEKSAYEGAKKAAMDKYNDLVVDYTAKKQRMMDNAKIIKGTTKAAIGAGAAALGLGYGRRYIPGY